MNGVDCNGIEWVDIKLPKQAKDIRNKKFNMLTPLFPVDTCKTKSRTMYWLCKCECGNTVVIRGDSIRNGHAKSCGCLTLSLLYNRFRDKRDSMIGRRFGRLLVTAFDCLKPRAGDQLEAYYWCQCDCGNSLVSIAAVNLVTGGTRSCGCIQSVGESNIVKLLDCNNINYIHNKAYFKDLFGCDGGLLRYDFILFNYNNEPYRIIEFDGEQHVKPILSFGGVERFEKQQKNDFIKNQYAISHNIPLVRIPYNMRDAMDFDTLMGSKYIINKIN